MQRRWLLLLLLLGIGASASVGQDSVELSRQIQVDGRIIKDEPNAPKPHLVVEVDPELRIAIPRSRVRKTTRSTDLEWYKSAVVTAGDDAELNYQLARKCKEEGLLAQRDYHFQRVIQIDPAHPRARLARLGLGFAEDGTQWVPKEQLQRSRGLILAGGKWQVPEVYARAKAREEAKKQASVLMNEFKKRRTSVIRGDKRSDESLKWMQEMNDPLSSNAFADALASSRGKDYPRSLRKLYVKKLGALRTPNAVGALIQAGLADPDTEIRTLALKEL